VLNAHPPERTHILGKECQVTYSKTGVRITCEHYLVEVPRDRKGPLKDEEKKRLRALAVERMSKLMTKKGSKRR